MPHNTCRSIMMPSSLSSIFFVICLSWFRVPPISSYPNPHILILLPYSAFRIRIDSGYDCMVCCLAHLVATISCSPYTRDGRRIVSSCRSPAAKQAIMCRTRAEQSFAAERWWHRWQCLPWMHVPVRSFHGSAAFLQFGYQGRNGSNSRLSYFFGE